MKSDREIGRGTESKVNASNPSLAGGLKSVWRAQHSVESSKSLYTTENKELVVKKKIPKTFRKQALLLSKTHPGLKVSSWRVRQEFFTHLTQRNLCHSPFGS